MICIKLVDLGLVLGFKVFDEELQLVVLLHQHIEFEVILSFLDDY